MNAIVKRAATVAMSARFASGVGSALLVLDVLRFGWKAWSRYKRLKR